MDKESKAYKYIKNRKCMGGDCTAKSQEFVLMVAAETAASLYAEEKIKEGIKKIKAHCFISGVDGLASKKDVIDVLKKLFL